MASRAHWIVSLTIVTYVGAAVVKRFPGYRFATQTGPYVIPRGVSWTFAARIIESDSVLLHSLRLPHLHPRVVGLHS